MEELDNDFFTLREIEAVFLGLFKVVLNRPQLGLDDSLFELGMVSLQATELISRINQTFDREVPRVTLCEHPTARTMAAWLTSSAHHQSATPNSFPTTRIGPKLRIDL